MTSKGRADESQRVRACLECGELVPYEERVCPHCDYHEPLLSGPPTSQDETCFECGNDVALGLIFCPRCGADRGPEPEQLPASLELPTQGGSTAMDLWGLVLVVLGPLLMATAVLLAFAEH